MFTAKLYYDTKIEKGNEYMEITQDSVREKLIEKCKALKIKYIAEQVGIPRNIISKFKNSRRDLWDESLIKLNAFLDKY